MKVRHEPVMVKEVINLLDPHPGDVVVDCTIGLGGHSEEILKMIQPNGRLIGIDRDSEALALTQERLQRISNSCEFVWDDFRNLDQIMSNIKVEEADLMLLDLGVSSYQLENPERGFSFRSEGPLDMRMDRKSFISAYDLVNSLSEHEISSILRNFGQEHWHNRIAHLLVQERRRSPIATTRQLSEIVLHALPHKYRHSKIHAATRTFQAFRIAVNRELESLEIVLEKSIDLLRPKGRLCVIAFHSLEDRIVKNKFRNFAKDGIVKVITKKPLIAEDEERQDNPRSRSAKLRAVEKL